MTAAIPIQTHERTYSMPEHHNHPNVFFQSLIHTEQTDRLRNANQITTRTGHAQTYAPQNTPVATTQRNFNIANRFPNTQPPPQDPISPFPPNSQPIELSQPHSFSCRTNPVTETAASVVTIHPINI